MKTINDLVREKLSEYMGKQNLTQYKLAELSGLPYSTVKSIMQKRTKGMSLKTVILLSYGLRISPSEFISGDEFSADNLNLD